MSVQRLAATGMVPYGGHQVYVGDPATLWRDGSDATYATVAGHADVLMSSLTPYVGGPIKAITLGVRASSTAGFDYRISNVQLRADYDPGSGTFGQFLFSWLNLPDASGVTIPSDGVIRTYTHTASGADLETDTTPDVIAAGLAGATALIAFDTVIPGVLIYEAWADITYAGSMPPQRMFPRDDGRGLSQRRYWPPPATQQASPRRGNAVY